MKKLVSIVLAIMLVLALAVPAFAANTGTITISNATADKTYNFYKIFDATYQGTNVAYTIEETSQWFDIINDSKLFDLQENAGNDGVYEVVRAKDVKDTDIIDFLKAVDVSGMTPDQTKKPTSDGEVKWTDAPYGYYFITSELGTVVTINTNCPDVTVIDKNQGVEYEKWIIDENNNKVKLNVAEVGEFVPYEVDVTAPNYKGDEAVVNYYVYDVMEECLTFDPTSVVVKINGTALAADAYEVITDDPETDADEAKGCTFVINIPWVDDDGEFIYTEVNNAIVVTYSAIVNEDVEIGTPMVNKAKYGLTTVSEDRKSVV